MPDYYIAERKLGPIGDPRDLPVRTAATPEEACKAQAVSVERAGTFVAIEKTAVAIVRVDTKVSRSITATRIG